MCVCILISLLLEFLGAFTGFLDRVAFFFSLSLSCSISLSIVVQSLSCIRLFVTPWIAAQQASLSSTVSWSLLRFTWPAAAAAAANSVQLCPTLCDPIDSGPPGSPVPGILQARTLEWVAISFSNA